MEFSENVVEVLFGARQDVPFRQMKFAGTNEPMKKDNVVTLLGASHRFNGRV